MGLTAAAPRQTAENGLGCVLGRGIRRSGAAWAAALAVLLGGLGGLAQAPTDPELTIPFCRQAPKIDGVLAPGEWDQAAAVTLFEAYASAESPRVMRTEQPLFYLCWDRQNLYLAMLSIESNTNTVVAACSRHDDLRLIGDDCVEMMVAPGAGEALKQFDFATYYFAFNSIGTVWDSKFVPLLNEVHNTWESGAELAHTVEGTLWISEMRLPLSAVSRDPPTDGTVWRLNLDRTYSGYHWSAWNAAGALNDARVGGNVTFASDLPAVRLTEVHKLVAGKLAVTVEVANPTAVPQAATLKLQCQGQPSQGSPAQEIGSDEQQVTVEPGKTVEVALGKGQTMLPYDQVTVEARHSSGKRLFFVQRDVQLPAPRFVRRIAPKVPLVYVFPRFLPSLERLAVLVDLTAWVKKTGHVGKPPVAEVLVFAKGAEAGKPVLAGTLSEFRANQGTWRQSTEALSEGEYTVKVRVRAASGEVIAEHDDWFEKRIFVWMRSPRGCGEAVPAPYTPLEVDGNTLRPWGRSYRLAETGLPAAVVSQQRELLGGGAGIEASVDGKPVKVAVRSRFAVTTRQPGRVDGKARLDAGKLALDLEASLEYDGFLRYRLTYGPRRGSVTVNRLRLRLPIRAEYAIFLSASGDTQGTNIIGALTPQHQGRIYDSQTDTRSVCGSPTFATLFWVGDHETCFCYAADSDQGWVLRDDAPAVEVWREGENLVLWLNFVDRPVTLREPRILEFAFQAGPLKPLPPGWRGLQDSGDPDNAPATLAQAGTGHALAGGACFLYPGSSPEQLRMSRDRIAKYREGGNKVVSAYHYWGTVPKGLPEARVFRGEWGLDRFTWESSKQVEPWPWQNRLFGENKDLYVILYPNPVPSYVEFITWAYDEALKTTALDGFYDDTGYPKPVYDEELGLGFRREDGRPVYSSGLWLYRERWKRAAYLNWQHQRPNCLRDSQHVHAHFLPAYGFIGIWAPCERGFYNPFPDRDNLGFYGSVDRYASFNPAKAFGQVPMVGMASPQLAAPAFQRDTRNMLLLAFLNDQDVGTFGSRDLRTVAKLRRARNQVRPWADDITFTGYWASSKSVKRTPPELLISYWSAPGRALLVLGNVGESTVEATVEPDWQQLGLEPGKFQAVDAESGDAVAVDAGGGRGFRVEVARHDLRLILAGSPELVRIKPEPLGAALPGPAEPLAEFCDRFTGPELAPVWQKDCHEGNSGVSFSDGRLCLQGAHYGYTHVRREFGLDNVSVQCLILRQPSGCADEAGGSLFLYWQNGAYVQAAVGLNNGKFLYLVSGQARRDGSAITRQAAPGWFPHCANWVRIALRPDTIVCSGSVDGKTWTQDVEFKRDPAHAGPPQFLMVGNGQPGARPHLDNVVSAHYQPQSVGPYPVTFFSGLIVGRE